MVGSVQGRRPDYDQRMKYLSGLVLILLLAAGGAWVVAGRMAPPSIAIEGSLLTAIPDANRLAVGDAFTRHPLEIHAFFDKLIQDRLNKIEGVLARRNEEKKKTQPAPPAPKAKKS